MKKLQQYYFIITLLLVLNPLINTNEIIQMEEIYSGTLQPNQTKIIQFSITQKPTQLAQVYLTASTPYNNPLQLPSITLKSQDQLFKKNCFDDTADYTQICAIPNKQLKLNRTFIAQIRCIVRCQFQISPYMNQVVKLQLNDRVLISAMDHFGLANALQINIPSDLNFTQIVLSANIANIQDVFEGLQFKANIGNPNTTQIPTQENFELQGQSSWDQGLSIILSKQEINPGDSIKILIFAPQKMKVKFYSYIINGNTYQIELNKEIKDFISYKEDRVYILNVANKKDQIADDDIDVTCIIYSGTPSVTVSFDSNFSNNKVINNNYIQGKINTVLSPSVRKSFGFQGKLYIKIQSFWSSAFSLTVSLNKADFIPVFLQSTEISKLLITDVDNYIYQEVLIVSSQANSSQTTMSYVAKVQMIQGGAMFGVRRCKSLEQNRTMDCIIKSQSEVDDPKVSSTFDEIQSEMQQSYSTFQIRFNYDFKNCLKYDLGSNLTKYTCIFQFVAFVDKSLDIQQIQYAFTLYQRKFSAILKQGQIVKDTVDKQNYHFYQFILPDIKSVSQVAFFFTTIQGDILLLQSNQVRYPTLFDIGGLKQIQLGMGNKLIFKDQDIQDKYFISVYGYQKSDYTLTVSILRNNQKEKKPQQNKTSTVTQISLRQAVVQSYTLSETQKQMIFTFNAKQNSQVQVLVSGFQGTINYGVFVIKKDNKNASLVSCETQGVQGCKFKTSETQVEKYLVKVFGDLGQVQVFTVSYRYSSKNQCLQYPMNNPMSINLKKGQKFCNKYIIKQPKQIQVVIDLSTLELLQGDMQANFIINPDSSIKQVIQIMDHNKKIQKQQLQKLCIKTTQNSTQFDMCTVQIQFQTKQDVAFKAMVEQTSHESILFDGVSQKVISQDITNQKGKYFYYNIYKDSSVKFYFTTQAQGNYLAVAKLINQSQYMSSSQSKFGKFNDQENLYTFRKQINNSMIMTQFVENISKFENCSQCVMLISIFRTDYNISNDFKLSAFTIQITQTQSDLAVGQTKIGYVDEGQLYNYDVSTYGLNQGVFYISFLKSDNCAQIMILNEDTHRIDKFKSYALLQQPNKQYRVIIKGIKPCSYQVSFADQRKPVSQIIKEIPYLYIIDSGKTQFILYYNQYNQSFRVISAIQTGDVKLKATPISLTKEQKSLTNEQTSLPTLEQATKDSFNSFTYGENGAYSQIQIKNTDKNYCFKCYYIISLTGITNVKTLIGIIAVDQPIPLLQSTIFKDKIQPNKDNKVYSFHSINQFNVSFNILYGKARVIIQTPNKDVLYNQTINSNKQFSVDSQQVQQNYDYDPYSQKTLFLITVSSVQQNNCQYSIQIKKQEVNFKIKQGLPYILELDPSQSQTLKFINLDDKKENITILIQMKSNIRNYKQVLTLSFQTQKNGVLAKILDSQIKIQKIQNSFMIIFPSKVTNYLMTFKNKNDISISYQILLVKDSLSHLTANTNIFYNKQIIYEIYPSNQQSIMIEAFQCKGGISIIGSQTYQKIQNNQAEVSLQHADQAGHYVISADKQIGNQLFLKIYKKTPDVLYRIGYSYYPLANQGKTRNPYKILFIDQRSIFYNKTQQNITFSFSGVKIAKQNPSGIQIEQINYILGFGKTKEQVSEYLSCSIGKIFKQNQIVTSDFDSNQPSITISRQQIQQDLQIKNGNIYVQGKAEVKIKYPVQKNYYQKKLEYIYDITQVIFDDKIPEQPPVLFTLQILVIIGVCFLAGAIFLLLALRYCWRRFKQNYFHAELVEQENVGPSQDGLKYDNNSQK